MRTYAIADVHGQRAALARAHALVEEDRARTGDRDAPVVHLGDLVDRGPDSAGVVADLVEGIAAGRPWLAILGNHDRLLRTFLEDAAVVDGHLREAMTWLHPGLGGVATLASYGVMEAGARPLEEVHAEARARVPEAHRAFLRGRPLWVERGETLFVHAGILPGIPLHLQEEDDLVWIRGPFLEHAGPHPWLVVHGHTVVEAPAHLGNRVALDTGAGYGRPLTAAVFEGREAFVLTEEGRAPLRPPEPEPARAAGLRRFWPRRSPR